MGLDANEWASRRTLVFRPGKRASASVKVSHPCCGITDLNPHLVGQSHDDLKRPSGIDAYPFSSTKAGLFCCTGDRSGFQRLAFRSEEHTSELQSLMRISCAVFCLKKKN